MTAAEPSRLLSVGEAAEYLGVGKTTTFKLLREGTLQPVKIGRRTLVTRDELDRYVASLTAA